MYITQLLFRIYVRFIRPHTEKKLQKLFSDDKVFNCTIWNTFKHLPMEEFSAKVNSYEYKPDLLNGAVDFAYDNPNYFFSNLGVSRDCDDFARIWYHYGLENGYVPQEVVVTTTKHVARDAHVVCVLEKDFQYWMCDYTVRGPFTSLEQAVEDMPNHWEKYTNENMLWEYYR